MKKQFFITDDKNKQLDERLWNKNEFGELSVHVSRDYELIQASHGDQKVAIIGFIFDSTQPRLNTSQIAEKLAKQVDLNALMGEYDKFSGKFILLYQNRNDTIILTDFFSLKRIFYCYQDGKFYSSGSEKFLNDQLNTKYAPCSEKASLVDKSRFLNFDEYWTFDDYEWIKELKILFPNHYLDLKNKSARRLPIKKIEIKNIDELVDRFSTTIKNTLDAATQFKKYVALTAGYDSRLIYSVANDLGGPSIYYTFRREGLRNKIDVKMAKKIAKATGHLLMVIEPKWLDKKFLAEYNDFFINPRVLPKTQNIQWFNRNLSPQHLNITGDGGALLRSWQSDNGFEDVQSVNKVYNKYSLKGSKEYIGKWYEEAKAYCSENKIAISDLFYLEMRMGKWGALSFQEMEISGVEEFTPYANRGLCMLILQNKSLSSTSPNSLFEKVMEYNTPGITKFKFNPKTWKDRVKALIFRRSS